MARSRTRVKPSANRGLSQQNTFHQLTVCTKRQSNTTLPIPQYHVYTDLSTTLSIPQFRRTTHRLPRSFSTVELEIYRMYKQEDSMSPSGEYRLYELNGDLVPYRFGNSFSNIWFIELKVISYTLVLVDLSRGE